MGGQGTGAGHVVRPRPLVLATPVHQVGTRLHVARAIAGQQQHGGVLEPEVALVRRVALQGPRVTVGGLGPSPGGRRAPGPAPPGRRRPPPPRPPRAAATARAPRRATSPAPPASRTLARAGSVCQPVRDRLLAVHVRRLLSSLVVSSRSARSQIQRLPALAGSLRLAKPCLPEGLGQPPPGRRPGGVIRADTEPMRPARADLGSSSDGFLVVVDGLVQSALVRRALPRLAWATREPGIDADGLLQVPDGLVQPARRRKACRD